MAGGGTLPAMIVDACRITGSAVVRGRAELTQFFTAAKLRDGRVASAEVYREASAEVT